MNEKFNKNAKVEKFTTMLGIAVRLIVIDPLQFTLIVVWTKCKLRTRYMFKTWCPQEQLEWGCPNGTKYPPQQPIQTYQVMRQKGEAVVRQKPFSVILAL